MADQKQGSDRDLAQGIGGGSSAAASAGATSATRTPPSAGPASAMSGGAHEGGQRAQSNGNGGSFHDGDVAERARGMAGQIFGDVRHAAEGLLDEQKDRAVDAVQGVADTLRRTAQTFEGDNQHIARYAEQAADQVERFAENFRERNLGDIVADLDDFARRQPTVFLIGAVAAGFVVGRFMASSAERHHAASAESMSGRRQVSTRPRHGGQRTAGHGAAPSSNFSGTRGTA